MRRDERTVRLNSKKQRSTRWCPRCDLRCEQEAFSLLHDQAYLGDGGRRVRIYEHGACQAIVVVFVRYNQQNTS
ncbi:MAG: hypothetical protein M3P30_08340 [Chloroflexota bacterium]|nr:hypothetical protein [Chloroflexota bacterium]